MKSHFTAIDDINFLIASPLAYSCTEAARVQPATATMVAHDSINRFLCRGTSTPEDLWQEAQSQVVHSRGVLVIDDSTLDKPYAHPIDLAHRHWKGYGLIKVFQLVAPDGDREYWASSDVQMDELQRVKYAQYANTIEQYHRGIKQYCGIGRCQLRGAQGQRHLIALALRAFLRLESYCFHAGMSWWAAKIQIIRQAVRQYLAQPIYLLVGSA
jgi:hypothetical protein